MISREDVKRLTTQRNSIWNEVTDAEGRGLDEILDSLPSVDAVPQWIPCNEMLPDGRLNKSYLVQDKDGRLAVGTYTNWGWMFGHYMNDPVAWMPLPEPYERKES